MTCVIDISLLQFGQLSIVGTTEHARLVFMTLPFARQNVGASKRLTLDWVPVSLKSKSWNWLGRFATAARLPILLCAHYSKESREKKQVTALVVTATPPALLRVVLEHLHALRRTRAA